MNKIIDDIMENTPIISGMVNKNQILIILENLYNVISSGVEGDVVELGCSIGTTSIFIRKLLDAMECDKEYHVYDSFQGLPEKNIIDNPPPEDETVVFEKGKCARTIEEFTNTFEQQGASLPHIHEGWFSEIDPASYPEKICFAFFDGDFYTSIIDSFNMTYHKISKNGIILVHDYGYPPLPGVEIACSEWLADKPEKIHAECGVGKLKKVTQTETIDAPSNPSP